MGRKKKYQTEEERKQARKEYNKQYMRKRYQANREKILEQQKQYKQANRERLKEYNKQYYQDHVEYHKEHNKQYKQDNAEKIKEYNKQYRKDNKERLKEYDKQYRKTPMGRALYLLNRYNRSDKEYNRGKGDLTAQWIVERIFSQPCAHCGKEGWEVIGCNRLDNSLPHTMDNVEPCCFDCNRKIG